MKSRRGGVEETRFARLRTWRALTGEAVPSRAGRGRVVALLGEGVAGEPGGFGG